MGRFRFCTHLTGHCTGWLWGATLFLIAAAGCSPKQTVILVPDPDGHVGAADVITDGGRQSLEKSGDMTRVSSKAAPPSPVTTADTAFITALFSDALLAEPSPPEKFILFFETGGTALLHESENVLLQILAAIKNRGAISVSVSGHTDSAGSVLLNEKLARERAEAISDMLVRGGVSTAILRVSSHGKGNPLVPTPDGVAEPKNRRVEIVVR